MSGMLEEERFDGMLLQFAQQCQGIEPLLDTVFSFLRRKTDFFTGAATDKATQTVLKMLEKHASLAEKTDTEKRKKRADDEDRATARKDAARKRRDDKAKAPAADDGVVEVGESGADISEAPAAPAAADVAVSSEEKKDEEEEEDKTPPPPGNGGVMAWGRWTQELADLQLYIPVPAGLSAKSLVVDIGKGKITVGVKGAPPILDGPMHKKVIVDDCFWTLEEDASGGKEVVISLQKEDKMSWWKCIVVGEVEINTQKVQPENSKLSDLDGDTRMTVEKMMFDQRQKALGKPTSDEMGKQDVLEKFMKSHPEMDFSKAKFS
ncbi:HSP20-like chaperone [Pelagophyceae sp. CCMP2097]|nr:HSP20-like chaperone [Pelagophyceae sp. CCMP2097]